MKERMTYAEFAKAASHKPFKPRGKVPRDPPIKSSEQGRAVLNARPQCQAMLKDGSRRCEAKTIRGATRCHNHGGYAEAGTERAARAAARLEKAQRDGRARFEAERRKHPPELRDQVRAILASEGQGSASYRTVTEACDAYTQEDAGKSWRAFLSRLTHTKQTRRAKGTANQQRDDKINTNNQ